MMRNVRAAAIVVAALMVSLPAVAQFQAADLVYVPAVAHTPGENDSAWRSDIYITSVEEEVDIDVAIVFLASGQVSNAGRFFERATWLGGREEEGWGHINEDLADIPPGGTVIVRDIVGEYWADEVGVSNSGALVVFAWEAGTLEDDGSRVFADVLVNSRVYTRTTFFRPDPENEEEFVEVRGTYGQTMPGVPWYNVADPSARNDERDFSFMLLVGAAEDEDFRYNVGILNASDPLTSITVVIQPFRGDGEPFTDVDGFPIVRQTTIPPLGHLQYNQILLNQFGFAVAPDDILLKVSFVNWASTSAEPVVGMTVYGTLIDNATNDPTAVLPLFAFPYDLDCVWPPVEEGEGEKSAGARTLARRPIDLPGR